MYNICYKVMCQPTHTPRLIYMDIYTYIYMYIYTYIYIHVIIVMSIVVINLFLLFITQTNNMHSLKNMPLESDGLQTNS